ncbi:MAG TPA: serine/threonine-protein kinase [Polyangiaceae bacterium]|nr:serine/threonine-protein kinase [Polyangiaceae bacterium]
MATQNQSKVPDGTLLEGKFRVTREIGRGGMAAVYEAENVDIGKRVAVKILAAELITSRIVRERFLREARAAAAVRSPYICDVYDSGMYEERPFLVMELLEGESLYDLLTRVRQLDFENTLRIATHAARGLGKAHESNIVHRDLKPENIFLTKDEEGKLLAKLVDFGLAKFYEPTGADAATVRLTREGALFGTPAYMSPEQAKGKGEVDHRADLWALGCIVYECLTGQTVWSVDQGVAMILAQIASAPLPRPSKLRPDLPPAFEQWFHRALDRDPSKRFQNARHLADALAKALKPSAPAARSISLSSDHEGMVVDELMDVSERLPKEELDALLKALPEGDAQPPTVRAIPEVGAVPPSSDPSGPGSQTASAEASSGKAISILMFVALVCLGGYAAWLYVLNPPGKSTPKTAATAKATPGASAGKAGKAGGKSNVLPESEPYAKLLFEAQDLLTNGTAKAALEGFKTAFAAGAQPPARSLLNQVTVIAEEGGGTCRVSALGRPRPFTIETPCSRPTVVKTDRGTLYAWVDAHADPKKRQGYAVLLDGAMRRISEPVPVTPEAPSVRTLQLLPMASGAALLFWDDSSDAAGVYVRHLDSDGKIAGPARRISDMKRGELHPTLTTAEGGFWAIWEEDVPRTRVDLMARQLDDRLEIKGNVVRLAQLASAPRSPSSASSPDAVVAQGSLQVVLSVDRGVDRHQIMLLRIPTGDAGLTSGLSIDKKKKLGGMDVNLGTLSPISRATSKNTTPRIACEKTACAIVWDDDNAGAYAAYIDTDKAEPLWHREFSAKGIRPTLASSGDTTLIAWYEEGRLKITELNRDGLGKPSTLARVNGFQPDADVTRGEKPGQWLVAFRDYESAHFEAFALRTECQ